MSKWNGIFAVTISESIISHTFQYLQSIPELKTLPWFLMTYMMKFNILRKPHKSWLQPLWPHFLYFYLCSLSSCYPSILAVLHYISSFLLENQQACCSLSLVHSSPLLQCSFPRKGRKQDYFLFWTSWPCFCKFSDSHGTNRVCFFYSHPLPDPNRGVWRMLAPGKKCNLLYTLPVSEQKDERSEDPKPWQPWCHQMLAVCFWHGWWQVPRDFSFPDMAPLMGTHMPQPLEVTASSPSRGKVAYDMGVKASNWSFSYLLGTPSQRTGKSLFTWWRHLSWNQYNSTAINI